MEHRGVVAAGLGLAVLVAAVVAVAAVWLSGPREDDATRSAAPPSPSPSAAPSSPATTTPSPSRSATAGCDEVSHPFRPRTIVAPGVTAGARVVAPPRDANGVPGVAPLTAAGKRVFAWDRAQGTRPGGARGNVLLNAHTWPDGTALGNWLLDGLHEGDRIVVHGRGARLCYRVTERVQVPGDRPMYRYYARKGPPQLAIVVCSGRRLAPGVWAKRTVWFASPAV